MGELVFFAVLILFSILESIARKQKERQQEGAEEGDSPTAEPRAPRRDRQRAERAGAARREAGERGDAAETMLPADLWEEIAGLASGRLPDPRPEPTRRRPRKPGRQGRRLPEAPPRPSVPKRAEEPRMPSDHDARSLEHLDVEPIEDEIRTSEVGSGRWAPSTAGAHPIHRTHREYGTDPSQRLPSEQDWRPAEAGNPNAKRVRALLRGSGGTDALKQAVMLQEILGPPASLKQD